MNIIPDKRKLLDLVQQVYEGSICLPDFQRDFVWPPDQIADLLRSILRGYFVGSLLLLRCDKHQPPFSPALLRGAKQLHVTPQPEQLLLDGQQRLTALIYALTAPNLPLKGTKLRRWFFVDLDKLTNNPDDDDIVLERSLRDVEDLNTPEAQFRCRLLPCTALMQADGFYKWRDKFEDWMRSKHPEQETEFRGKWRSDWQIIVDRFQRFEVPLVELPRVEESDPDAIGRVCAIFEKLNSTGVELSVYDLLTARLYRTGIALHKLWDEACSANPRLNAWSGGSADSHKFGVLVLRTLALLRGLDPKPKMLISLPSEKFEEDWKRAARAIERALEIVTATHVDGFGVFNQQWLPNYGLLPILAALRAEIEEKQLGDSARAEVRHWYWCSVFLERFSSAVESKSRKDYSEFARHWFENGPAPEIFKDARRIGSPEFSVRSASSNASGIYCGVFCLLAKNGARDWRLGESIELQQLEDHHIFPQDYLKRNGFAERDGINTVVNRTLIADQTNGKIKALAPAAYLNSEEVFPAGATPELLRPHFLSANGAEAMRLAVDGSNPDAIKLVYDKFLAAREASIIEAIREACGVSLSGESSPAGSLIEAESTSLSEGTEESDEVKEDPIGANSELSPHRQIQHQYWSAFLETLRERKRMPVTREPRASSWMGFPIGGSGYRLWTEMYLRDRSIGVGISCRAPRGKHNFNLLRASKATIEEKLGFAVDWDERDEDSSSYIAVYRDADFTDNDDWKEQHKWLSEKLERFQEVFQEHIVQLSTANVVPVAPSEQ